MMGINIILKLLIVVGVIVISVITPSAPTISDRRLCYDPKCSVPVSTAVTLMDYNSNDHAILSFKSNTKVQVFSKSAGKRKDLWGVEIGGKRGYVPEKFIKEKTILQRKLIHDVPTEDVIPSNEATPITKKVPKVADKVGEKFDNVSEKPLTRETSKIDKIVDKVKPESIPEPDHISPSFEVHDGTTIPLVINEEHHEPSYSTSTPRIIAETEEHPVLSVHPNIASSVTLKNHENELVDDSVDAEKYLKLAGLSDEASSRNTENTGKERTAEEIFPNDASSTNETNLEDETSSDEGSPNREKIGKLGELSPITSDPSSQEEPLETTKVEEKSDSRVNDPDLGKQVAGEVKTTETNVEQRHEKEKTTDVPVEHVDEKITDLPVEEYQKEVKTTESSPEQPLTEEKHEIEAPEVTLPATLELPKITAGSEKISTKDTDTVQKDEKITEDSAVFVEDNVTTETLPATPELPKSTASSEKISTKDTDTVQKVEKITEDSAVFVEDNVTTENRVNAIVDATIETETSESSDIAKESFREDLKESENIVTTENGLPDEEDSTEELIEEKSTEDLPRNLNIMNPLFNRLSMLPSMVKEVVVNKLSGTDVKERSDDDSSAEESEMKSSSEKIDDVAETSGTSESSPGDSPTGTTSEHDTTKPKVVDGSLGEFVNTDHDNDNNNNINPDSEKNKNDSTVDRTETQKNRDFLTENPVQPGIYKKDELSGFGQENLAVDETSSFNGFPTNRNLLNVGSGLQPDDHKSAVDSSKVFETENLPESDNKKIENEAVTESTSNEVVPEIDSIPDNNLDNEQGIVTETADSCLVDSTCPKPEDLEESFPREVENSPVEEGIDIMNIISTGRNYWETLTYLVVTAFTTLLFSLGYYYIENTRRDGQYIAKINKLEKQLLVCSKECTVLDDTLKSTKTKLDSIEDESFGSNEMVASLKADLEASKTAKSELEDQVGMLEKELESATEAGLELERMLREILSTNNEDNPLAQSIEDLQTRLNAQQAANEALTNALNLKSQENENLTAELKAITLKSEQLEVEVTRVSEELKHLNNVKSNLEQTLLEKIEHFEKQIKDITAERINLRKQLKGKEIEMKDVLEVVNQMNISNLDVEKLYNVSRVKAEASQLLEERDELKIRLSEVEGAHQLLEEHVKLINEEVSSLSEQCKLAEKAKRDAETRVEVLSNFFKEKEDQRQKEEAIWLQKQGEVSSTVERLHTMQNEIHNYKQQTEMLKREILDQEREYKNQISALETKAHENWVVARQNERRLEESKVEAGQLRNRLTLIEKNINDTDPEAKLHRLEANGETATSPQLFIGAEASSSPIMFTGSSGVPLPPPPSYLYGPPVPPFLPPPPHGSSGISSYDVGQRPPPLGGRLSSPPPLHSTNSGRYENPRSPPPPLSPSMIPNYGPPHRAYPPPFPNDRIHPPPPPHSSMLPPPLGTGSQHSWPDEALPPLRNSGFQPHHQQSQQQHHQHHHHQHQHHRDNQPRARNHKGSLHSSGESLDKNL